MPSTLDPRPSTEFQDRLITLSDGRPGLRGGIHIECHEPVGPVPPPGGPSPTRDSGLKTQDSSHCLDFIASDETLDRYDEIVTANGWKLESYRRNPVFQNAHKYGDIIFTLGRALTTEVRSIAGRQALCQTVEFAVDINPMAKIAYGLYKGKFLNAVSVGFIPLKWENGDGTGSRSTGSVGIPAGEVSGPSTLMASPARTSPTLNQQFRRRYTSQELLEVSAVGIPANPNALALGLKSGAIEKSDLQDTLDLLRGFCDSEFKVQSSKFKVQSSAGPLHISPIPPISPISPIPKHDQLLKIARDLHTLLRRA